MRRTRVSASYRAPLPALFPKLDFLNFSGSVFLNESDIRDKVILGKTFRDMKSVELYGLSRAPLEKTRKLDFGIVISIIKIRKFSGRESDFFAITQNRKITIIELIPTRGTHFG